MAVWFFPSCGGGGQTASPFTDGGDTLKLKYAANLTIVDYGGYYKVELRNPWDTLRVLHTYILVEDNSDAPDSLLQGTVIHIPLQNAVVYSSVHCGLIDELGALEAVGGVCDLRYIEIPYIREGCRNGSVADLGNSMNPDIERLIDLHPDAVLLSPFENSGGYGRLDKLDIPLVECADYMETSALGRAEWMRFFGLLFGRSAEADSLFARVENGYLSWKARANGTTGRPSIFTDTKSGATWYVPGGRSTIGRLLADAGGKYVFGYLDKSGSVPLNFETVYDKARDADVWIIRYNAPVDMTLSDLKSDYAPYEGFEAFKKRKVYGCNTGRVPYYEQISFHPEWLLEDFIKIFHSGEFQADSLRYFSKLAD